MVTTKLDVAWIEIVQRQHITIGCTAELGNLVVAVAGCIAVIVRPAIALEVVVALPANEDTRIVAAEKLLAARRAAQPRFL